MFDKLRQRLRREDLQGVLAKKDAILARVKGNTRLKKFTGEVGLFFSMVSDYVRGQYNQVPLQSILAIAGALLYIFNPFDVIPDFIAGLGLVDDATVITYCLKLVKADVDKYRAWKTGNASEAQPVE